MGKAVTALSSTKALPHNENIYREVIRNYCFYLNRPWLHISILILKGTPSTLAWML